MAFRKKKENLTAPEKPVKRRKVLLIIATIFFLMPTVLFLPELSGFIGLLGIAICFPVNQWQDFVNSMLKGPLKAIVIVALMIAAVMFTPASEGTPTSDVPATQDETEASVLVDTTEEATEEPISTPEATDDTVVTAASAPSAEPTKESTAESTKAPTAKPTKAATAEPTKAPTAKPTKAPTTEPTKAPTTEPTKEPTPSPTPDNRQNYVLNTNPERMRIHKPSCSSVDEMNESNKKEVYSTIEELEKQGYTPCGRCKPR